MLSLEQIKTMLEDRNLIIVSQRTGVSYRTILNIRNGDNKNPSFKSVEKLSAYLGDNK